MHEKGNDIFCSSLAEENMLSLSTQTISDQNIKTSQALHQFSNSLDKTNSYLKLLASQSMYYTYIEGYDIVYIVYANIVVK